MDIDEDVQLIKNYQKKIQKISEEIEISDQIQFSAQKIKRASYDELKSIIKELQNSGFIIYTQSSTAAQEVQENLANAGMKFVIYGSSEQKSSKSILKKFNGKELNRLISVNSVKTDRDNIRAVIFYGMPKNLQKISKESAKLARDGKPSKCIVLWRSSDKDRYEKRLKSDSDYESPSDRRLRDYCLLTLEKIFEYCSSSLCRRFLIRRYFNEQLYFHSEVYRDTCCDNCQKIILRLAPGNMIFKGVNESNMIDISDDLRLMLRAYHDFRALSKARSVLQGNISKFGKHHRMDYFGAGRGKSDGYWNLIFGELTYQNFVNDSLQQITPLGFNFLRCKSKIIEKRAVGEIRNHLEKKDIHVTLENGKVTITPKLKEEIYEDKSLIEVAIPISKKFSSKKVQPLDDTKDLFDFGVTLEKPKKKSECIKRKAESEAQEEVVPKKEKIDMRELFLKAFSRLNAENIYRPAQTEVPKVVEDQKEVEPVQSNAEDNDNPSQNDIKPGCSHWQENPSNPPPPSMHEDIVEDDEHLESIQEIRNMTHKPLAMPLDELLDYIEKRASENYEDKDTSQ